MRMIKIINEKYPAQYPDYRSLVIFLFFGAFISLFLIYFEPFGVSITKNQISKLFFYGVITTVVLLLFLYTIP